MLTWCKGPRDGQAHVLASISGVRYNGGVLIAMILKSSALEVPIFQYSPFSGSLRIQGDELHQYAVIIQYMVLELRHRYLSLYRYRPVVRRAVFASRI